MKALFTAPHLMTKTEVQKRVHIRLDAEWITTLYLYNRIKYEEFLRKIEYHKKRSIKHEESMNKKYSALTKR